MFRESGNLNDVNSSHPSSGVWIGRSGDRKGCYGVDISDGKIEIKTSKIKGVA